MIIKPTKDYTLDLYVDADYCGLYKQEDDHDDNERQHSMLHCHSLGNRLPIDWQSSTLTTPSFTGIKVFDDYNLDELRARIRRTLEILESHRPEQVDGNEQREIRLQLRSGEMTFTGIDYLFQFVLPNVYFHVTTAYNILRHNGVVLGKRDFLGGS